jgi:hypothetical protein
MTRKFIDNGNGPWLYVMKSSRFLKIGITSIPVNKRLNNIRVSNPNQVFLLYYVTVQSDNHNHPNEGCMRAEAYIHSRLSSFHVKGEWFRNDCFTTLNTLLSELKLPCCNRKALR